MESPEVRSEFGSTTKAETLLNADKEFAERVRALPKTKKSIIYISAFFWRDRTVHIRTDTQRVSLPRNISAEIFQLWERTDKEDISPQAIALMQSILENHTLITNIDQLDRLLAEIANNENIPTDLKDKFFGKVRSAADRHLAQWTEEQLQGNEMVSDATLPISATYVLNPNDAEERMQALRDLKAEIKRRARETGVEDHLDIFMPAVQKGEVQAPLKKSKNFGDLIGILYAQDDNEADQFDPDIAKLELLRLHRESLNTLIAKELVLQKVAEEQRDMPDQPMRIGDEYSAKHRKFSRRLGLFMQAHYGTVKDERLMPQSGGNLIPTDSELINLTKQAATLIEVDKRVSLSTEQTETLNQLKTEMDREVEPSEMSQIILIALQKLGIASDTQTGQQQIRAYQRGEKPVQTTKFYPYQRDGQKALTVLPSYGLVLLPKEAELTRSIVQFLPTAAHELTHVLQQVAKERGIPTLDLLATLGRSEITAEAGAMYVQALMMNLFDKEMKMSLYHYEALTTFMSGGTFWDIFNINFQHILEIDEIPSPPQTEDEKRERQKAIRTAIRRTKRVYVNLGAPGDPQREEGRYPTSTALIRYTLQALSKYAAREGKSPFVSGIPSHREEVASITPVPMLNGEKIEPQHLIRAVIEAAGEVLLQ